MDAGERRDAVPTDVTPADASATRVLEAATATLLVILACFVAGIFRLNGSSLSVAPLTLVGERAGAVAGAERAAPSAELDAPGDRAFAFVAVDAQTGRLAWRFYTVPGDPSLPVENDARTTTRPPCRRRIRGSL